MGWRRAAGTAVTRCARRKCEDGTSKSDCAPAKAARSLPSSGWSASSMIPTSPAPNARDFAPAPPISSCRDRRQGPVPKIRSRAWSISGQHPAAGARSRRHGSAHGGPRSRVRARSPRYATDARRRFFASRFSGSRSAAKTQDYGRGAGRRRALRHGGKCDRTPQDRPFANCGVGGGGRDVRPRGIEAGGGVSAKVLQGGTEGALLAELKRDFATVKHVKPAASRSDSAELYVLATGFRH